jgi:8-oxo-dGTP pyrophosphatase MutT (NUDIX family)
MINLARLTTRLASRTKHTNLLVESATKAAVLIPICLVNTQEAILFTIRSSNLSTHASEVSFPGGKAEETDSDFIDTALRETCEEIPGISRDRIRVLGSMTPVPSKGGKHNVYLVVGYIDGELGDVGALEKNDGEVELVFGISVDYLMDPVNQEGLL